MAEESAPQQPSPLEALPEDWERALCVVAHPDDLEYGAAAAIARWTGQGKWVGYVMVTSGEAGIDAMAPAQAREVREDEEVRSARVVGVESVDFLGLPDGVLEYGVALRRAIAAEVRRHRPEVVITGNLRETFGGTALNQADHIAVGRATLDAVRDAANRWVFTDQLVEAGGELERWDGVRAVWAFGSPRASHAVDTTRTQEKGVASLEEHRAYIEGLGSDDFDPREFLEGMARQTAQRLGDSSVGFAAAFEVFEV